VRPRAGLDIWRKDKFLAIAVIRTLDCPSCSLVTVLIMPCHLHSVPNKIKFGYEMCTGKELGQILGFVSDEKHAYSYCKFLPDSFLMIFNDGFKTVF
jgi:hypothetical protein